MSRYDGLIIPRSYSEYINKTDAATLLQALQLSGVMDNAPTANSNHPAKSGGVYDALAGKQPTLTFDDTPTVGSNNPVKSSGLVPVDAITNNDMHAVTSNAVANRLSCQGGTDIGYETADDFWSLQSEVKFARFQIIEQPVNTYLNIILLNWAYYENGVLQEVRATQIGVKSATGSLGQLYTRFGRFNNGMEDIEWTEWVEK